MRIDAVDVDDLIGAVRVDGVWRFYATDLAHWILDYKRYDPSAEAAGYRGRALVADVGARYAYLEVMSEFELDAADLASGIQKDGSLGWRLEIVVDFDERLYVNGWFDNIALHEYVPAGWKGIQNFPLDFVPDQIADMWRNAPEDPPDSSAPAQA